MQIDALDILGQTAKYLLITLTIMYALDCGLFQVRRMRGTALGSVAVEQYLQTPLKGQKAEYDFLGTSNQTCAHALFPQYSSSQWNYPCWWVARHTAQWQ
jgi:hypothetical protein